MAADHPRGGNRDGLQTAIEGEIVCRSQLDRRNRTTAMLRGEVRHTDDDRLLVTAIGAYAIFPRRRDDPRGDGGPQG